MKKEKMSVFNNINELMNAIQEKAVQLEEMARSLEGNYRCHNESSMPEFCYTMDSKVSYIGLEYSEKHGVRAVVKFQDIYTYDITDKGIGRNTYTAKLNLKDIQQIIKKSNEYERV